MSRFAVHSGAYMRWGDLWVTGGIAATAHSPFKSKAICGAIVSRHLNETRDLRLAKRFRVPTGLSDCPRRRGRVRNSIKWLFSSFYTPVCA